MVIHRPPVADLARQQKVNLTTGSFDATQCYDCIQPTFGTLACRRLGTPKKRINSMLKTKENEIPPSNIPWRFRDHLRTTVSRSMPRQRRRPSNMAGSKYDIDEPPPRRGTPYSNHTFALRNNSFAVRMFFSLMTLTFARWRCRRYICPDSKKTRTSGANVATQPQGVWWRTSRGKMLLG